MAVSPYAPAFPSPQQSPADDPTPGIDTRMYIATRLMAAMLRNADDLNRESRAAYANMAVHGADALIDALNNH